MEEQCRGIAVSTGRRCRHRPLQGTLYCKIHTPKKTSSPKKKSLSPPKKTPSPVSVPIKKRYVSPPKKTPSPEINWVFPERKSVSPPKKTPSPPKRKTPSPPVKAFPELVLDFTNFGIVEEANKNSVAYKFCTAIYKYVRTQESKFFLKEQIVKQVLKPALNLINTFRLPDEVGKIWIKMMDYGYKSKVVLKRARHSKCDACGLTIGEGLKHKYEFHDETGVYMDYICSKRFLSLANLAREIHWESKALEDFSCVDQKELNSLIEKSLNYVREEISVTLSEPYGELSRQRTVIPPSK